jgi:hypothetical protein
MDVLRNRVYIWIIVEIGKIGITVIVPDAESLKHDKRGVNL